MHQKPLEDSKSRDRPLWLAAGGCRRRNKGVERPRRGRRAEGSGDQGSRRRCSRRSRRAGIHPGPRVRRREEQRGVRAESQRGGDRAMRRGPRPLLTPLPRGCENSREQVGAPAQSFQRRGSRGASAAKCPQRPGAASAPSLARPPAVPRPSPAPEPRARARGTRTGSAGLADDAPHSCAAPGFCGLAAARASPPPLRPRPGRAVRTLPAPHRRLRGRGGGAPGAGGGASAGRGAPPGGSRRGTRGSAGGARAHCAPGRPVEWPWRAPSSLDKPRWNPA